MQSGGPQGAKVDQLATSSDKGNPQAPDARCPQDLKFRSQCLSEDRSYGHHFKAVVGPTLALVPAAVILT